VKQPVPHLGGRIRLFPSTSDSTSTMSDTSDDSDKDINDLDFDIHSDPPSVLPHRHMCIRLTWPLNFYFDPITSPLIANMPPDDIERDHRLSQTTQLCTRVSRCRHGGRGATVSAAMRLLPRQLSAA